MRRSPVRAAGLLRRAPRRSGGLKDTNNANAALRERPLKGLTILTGFSGGPTEWTGGSIYNAEDGRSYSGSITLEGGDTLKLRGCVVAPLCKTQTWTRLR